MKIFLTTAFVIALQLFANSKVFASEQLSWEVRLALAETTESFTMNELDTGLGIEAGLTYQITAHFAAYTAINIFSFDASSNTGIDDAVASDYGLMAGVYLTGELPTKLKSNYRFRIGTSLAETAVFENGNELGSTRFRTGWELGAGIVFSLGDKWQLVPEIGGKWQLIPEIRHRITPSRTLTLEPTATNDGFSSDIEMNYTIFSIGLKRSF